VSARPPSVLYKYRGISDFSYSLLSDGEIFFAAPDQFNDPHEFRFAIDYSAGSEEEKWRAISNRIKESAPFGKYGFFRRRSLMGPQVDSILSVSPQVKPWEEQVTKEQSAFDHTLRSSTGILSLSTRHNEILMWSHYADSHQGFCVGLSSEILEGTLGRLLPVTYSDEFPSYLYYGDVDPNDFLAEVCLRKSSSWSYEKEWRIVDFDKGPGVRRLPLEAIVSIFLGSQVEEETRDVILDDVIPNLPSQPTLFQCELAKSEFSLSYIRIR
jgi:hypothetical protein